MWLVCLLPGIPGAVIGALAWMGVMALCGEAALAWTIGFAPLLLLVYSWKIVIEGIKQVL